MGFLFQHAALFDSLTVGENVAFPLRRHRPRLSDTEVRRTARDKLAQVGLAADYDKMPGDLSGGMRKRAGLARAMALSPPMLLVDEPSAGLDPITAAEIDQLLVELKRQEGTTLVVVTHNIPSARAIGDELALLAEGRSSRVAPRPPSIAAPIPWSARSCALRGPDSAVLPTDWCWRVRDRLAC